MAQIVARRLAVRQARVRISARHPRGGPLPSGSCEETKSGTRRVIYINCMYVQLRPMGDKKSINVQIFVRILSAVGQQRLKLVNAVGDLNFLALSATAFETSPKCPKCRISSLNHQNFGLFGLVPKSPTNTGLICVNTLEPNIS